MNLFTIIRLMFTFVIFSCGVTVLGQTAVSNTNETATAQNTNSKSEKSELNEVIQLLREQQRELERLRLKIDEQSKTIEELRQRVDKNESSLTKNVPEPSTSSSSPRPDDTNARLSKVEEQTKKNTDAITTQIGSIRFSGDIRIRYDAIYNQLNAQPNADNPAIFGNEISSRQRFRFRARFGMRGQIGDTIEWGIRFASGTPANPVSTNQTFTDFFTRKPFELDQAYVAWTPKFSKDSKPFRFVAGKFEPTWIKTEMTMDNDVMVEGFSESYQLKLKNKKLESVNFIAWELPFFERNSAFVRNANGTVNVDESRRGGRDLALYGGQIQAKFNFNPNASLTVSVADHFYSGTQFISPVQVFGANLLIPVTITIPANGTTPAQTVTTQISVPRDFFVAGGNLGLSIASNNQTNRDGRLSSGFNLVDLIARLSLYPKAKLPVNIILNYVRNTKTQDVIVAGPNGANIFLPNNENSGYWAEIQLGKTQKRGDWSLGYTLIRIEKDAILSPFNFDDIGQQTDVRAHRLIFNYTLDPKIIFAITGIFAQRPNGLNGVFGTNPAGSLNRPATRLQFDTVFRF